jgi:hypothetical protein
MSSIGMPHSAEQNQGDRGVKDDVFFQLSKEWRINNDDDRGSECVMGPKTCLTDQILPVADLFR